MTRWVRPTIPAPVASYMPPSPVFIKCFLPRVFSRQGDHPGSCRGSRELYFFDVLYIPPFTAARTEQKQTKKRVGISGMKAPARDGTEIFDAEGKAQIGKVREGPAAAAAQQRAHNACCVSNHVFFAPHTRARRNTTEQASFGRSRSFRREAFCFYRCPCRWCLSLATTRGLQRICVAVSAKTKKWCS